MIDLLRVYLNQIKVNKVNGATLKQLKHFFRWKRSLQPESSSIRDQQPWITFDAINFLNAKVTSESSVFEFGGGGSTLFFVKRAKEVFTVEHDAEWFNNVRTIINESGSRYWQGYLIQPEPGKIVNCPLLSAPDHYTSEAEVFKDYNFRKYASKIDEFDDAYFHVILVDGRSRPSCMKHSIPKLRKGGYLVLDNSDRDYYISGLQETLARDFIVVLDNTGASPYSGIFTKTTIWRKTA